MSLFEPAGTSLPIIVLSSISDFPAPRYIKLKSWLKQTAMWSRREISRDLGNPFKYVPHFRSSISHNSHRLKSPLSPSFSAVWCVKERAQTVSDSRTPPASITDTPGAARLALTLSLSYSKTHTAIKFPVIPVKY